jgi:UDP-GlcNAc:undecaprenyl-phosphate/decaprenyl-phosphate GlcNAc-1-phosphate transferase
MFSYAIAFLVALTAAALLIPPIRLWAVARGLFDQPGGRKIHTQPVPRLGGIAIAIGFFLGVAVATLIPLGTITATSTRDVPAILAGSAVLVIAGVADDLIGLSPIVKLLAQVLAAVAAVALGLSLQLLNLPWGVLDLGVLGWPISVLWIVAVVNAINLIDGLDGLAAGVVLIALVAFFVIAPNHASVTLIVGAAAGATLGFLVYNLHPASIIMGDAGSMLLGFLTASVGIAISSPGSGFTPIYVPIVVLALPLGDMLWAVMRRSLGGQSVFEADAGHVHHRLLRGGMNQREVVVLLHLVAAAFAGLGVLLGRLA